MPRIKQNALQYKEVDFVRYLEGELKLQKKSHEHVGEILNITRQAVEKKIDRRNFTWREKTLIFRDLKTPRDERIRLLIMEDEW